MLQAFSYLYSIFIILNVFMTVTPGGHSVSHTPPMDLVPSLLNFFLCLLRAIYGGRWYNVIHFYVNIDIQT